MRNSVLLILLGLCCCTEGKKEAHKPATQGISINENDFTKYLDLLPRVTLPFEADCENCCDYPGIDHDNVLVSKFKPEGTTIVGLVEKTENRAVILVTYPMDMMVPSLKVYDLKGNLTGEMNFMTGYCGGEPGFYNKQFFRIDKKLSLSQIDTLYETTFDSLTFHTIDTIDIKVTMKNFKLNDKGEIVESNVR